MKHLQYSQKRRPSSIDISGDASGSEGKSRDASVLKIYKQTLAGSEALSHNPNVVDNIRTYCLYTLTFVLTAHAVVSKFKNFYERNVLSTEDVSNILRVIFFAVRNLTPARQQKIQSAIAAFVNQISYLCEGLLAQFKAISGDLYTQIDTVGATSSTVVLTIWQYTFSLWLPQ